MFSERKNVNNFLHLKLEKNTDIVYKSQIENVFKSWFKINYKKCLIVDIKDVFTEMDNLYVSDDNISWKNVGFKKEFEEKENLLFKFLSENTRKKDGNVILLEIIRDNFSIWMGKNVSTLDNGTFAQVNKDYIVEILLACKYCHQAHKKNCCSNYNRTQRSSKKIVRNLELI
jgi:hypothetical protein